MPPRLSNRRPVDPIALLRFVWHLPNLAKLYLRLFRDRRVPLLVKAIPVLAIAYAISPFDLLPDWAVPFLGNMDDIVIVLLALRLFVPLCPPDVVREHVRRIDRGE